MRLSGVVEMRYADRAYEFDGGTSFESPVRIDTLTPEGQTPSDDYEISADRAGNVFIAWIESVEPVVNVSHDFGVTWEGVQILGPLAAQRIELSSNPSGHVAVTWDGASAGLGFNLSRDFGQTWLPTSLVLNDGSNPVYKPMAMDGAGRVYSAWLDTFSGSVSGTVVDETGRPVPGMVVGIRPVIEGVHRRLRAVTDERGWFGVDRLPSGELRSEADRQRSERQRPTFRVPRHSGPAVPSSRAVGASWSPRPAIQGIRHSTRLVPALAR